MSHGISDPVGERPVGANGTWRIETEKDRKFSSGSGKLSASLIEEREDILRAAMDGIHTVAVAIASLSEEQREGAFEAAEHSYQQTARDLGFTEDAADVWVSAIMFRLRADVKRTLQG
jgi:hypothetical protein